MIPRIAFSCMYRGRPFYDVIDAKDLPATFSGTRSQCERFIQVRAEKMRRRPHADPTPLAVKTAKRKAQRMARAR